ncbi:MAG: hypothetical protein AAGA40_06170 [Cyanobacteria bacterium P01_E01_bin.45]
MSYPPRRLQRQDRLRPPRRRTVLVLRLAVGALIVLSVPIALECFARLITGVTGVADEFNQIDEPETVTAYRLELRTPQGRPVTPEGPPGQLAATYHPLVGYRLVPDRSTTYWSINSSGFRDDDEIAVEKPEGEIRIALLGGSLAFGQLSSGNDTTIAEQLEERLNDRVARQRDTPEDFQPEQLPFFADRVSEVLALPPRVRPETYRVINAAVPGYASGNELAWYVQHVAAYDPDIVVVLNGYADLILSGDRWGAEGVDIERLTARSQMGLGRLAWQQVKAGLSNLTLVRGFDYYVLNPEPEPAWRSVLGLNQWMSSSTAARDTSPRANTPTSDISSNDPSANLPMNDSEQQRRLNRYRNTVQQMAQLTSGMDSELLIVLQPELSGRDPQVLSATEREIALELGNTYQTRMAELFGQLEEVAGEVAEGSDNTTALSLYEEMNQLDSEAFRSPDSLTDEGNAVVADRLFEEVTQLVVVFPRPFDPNSDRPEEP